MSRCNESMTFSLPKRPIKPIVLKGRELPWPVSGAEVGGDVLGMGGSR